MGVLMYQCAWFFVCLAVLRCAFYAKAEGSSGVALPELQTPADRNERQRVQEKEKGKALAMEDAGTRTDNTRIGRRTTDREPGGYPYELIRGRGYASKPPTASYNATHPFTDKHRIFPRGLATPYDYSYLSTAHGLSPSNGVSGYHIAKYDWLLRQFVQQQLDGILLEGDQNYIAENLTSALYADAGHAIENIPGMAKTLHRRAKWFKRYMVAQMLLMYSWWANNAEVPSSSVLSSAAVSSPSSIYT